MSEFVTQKWTGLKEIQQKLEALDEKMAKTGVRNALRAGAEYVLSKVIANAPRASGFMAEHFDIKISLKKGAIAGSAFIGPNAKAVYSDRKETWGVRTAKMVAGWLEFGTKNRAKEPFITAGWEEAKEGALAEMVDDLKETVGLI
jgi:HK97 gp10 family phage protein